MAYYLHSTLIPNNTYENWFVRKYARMICCRTKKSFYTEKMKNEKWEQSLHVLIKIKNKTFKLQIYLLFLDQFWKWKLNMGKAN